MAKQQDGSVEILKIQDFEIEVERRGSGAPLVLLYGEEALELEAPFLDELATTNEIIILSPPGFGKSNRPDSVGNPDDISYVMLDALDALGLEDVTLMGCSFGGWIAAEIATKNSARIKQLILVDPYGIKVSDRWTRDIQDIWFLTAEDVQDRKYSDTKNGDIDYTVMADEKLEIIARNRESLALFGWQPYMHNPKLKSRLHRINVPTLVVWGVDDGIVTTDYGKAYTAEIPGAKFEAIKQAGHYPQIEQPAAFVKLVSSFIAKA
jgi:pimeloyl-ACP methyl ester carboxylesterase